MKNLIIRAPQESNMSMPFFIKFVPLFLTIFCIWGPTMSPETLSNYNKMESLMLLIALPITPLIIIWIKELSIYHTIWKIMFVKILKETSMRLLSSFKKQNKKMVVFMYIVFKVSLDQQLLYLVILFSLKRWL